MNGKRIVLILIPVAVVIALVASSFFSAEEKWTAPTTTPSPVASPTTTSTQTPKPTPSPSPITTITPTTTHTQTLTPTSLPTQPPTPMPTPSPTLTTSPISTPSPTPTISPTQIIPTPTREDPNPKIIYREGQIVEYYARKGSILVGVYLHQYFRNDGGPGNVTATISFKCQESDEREEVWTKEFFMDKDEEAKAVAHVSVSANCAIFKDFNCCPSVHPSPPGEKLFYYTWTVRQSEPSDEDVGSITVERNV